jgi:hypothetical protein
LIRGGWFALNAHKLRAAFGGRDTPEHRSEELGFRLVSSRLSLDLSDSVPKPVGIASMVRQLSGSDALAPLTDRRSQGMLVLVQRPRLNCVAGAVINKVH